jgi:hypothetical protein
MIQHPAATPTARSEDDTVKATPALVERTSTTPGLLAELVTVARSMVVVVP